MSSKAIDRPTQPELYEMAAREYGFEGAYEVKSVRLAQMDPRKCAVLVPLFRYYGYAVPKAAVRKAEAYWAGGRRKSQSGKP